MLRAIQILAFVTMATSTFASSDALIDTLERKGLLTSREAMELKEQTYKDTRDMFPGTKIVIGSWLDELKIYGDVRLRYEQFMDQKVVRTDQLRSPNGLVSSWYGSIEDRARFRYRLRLGMAATAGDFKGVLRLASGENQSNANGNGDPISTNSTFDTTDSKKPVYIDQAYIAYNPSWFSELTFAGGKLENPFFYTPMVFDADWTPEGLSEAFVFPVNDQFQVFFTAAQIAIEENARGTGQQASGNGRDIFLFGEQAGIDWKIIDKQLGLKSAIALYTFDGLDKTPVTLPSAGNPLHAIAGTAAANVREAMNTIDFNNQIRLGFLGENLPITLYGDYIYNLASVNKGSDGLDDGWYVGLKLGEAKKQGQWEIAYWYEELGANAFLDAIVDSDFGYGGTNNKGHIVKAAYAVTDFMTLNVSLWLVENRDDFARNSLNVPGGAVVNGGDSRHQTTRVQFDANLKF
jgi:putative porin